MSAARAALALSAEIAAWTLGAAVANASLAFFRVQGHLGVSGFALAAAVGIAAMFVRARGGYLALALAALALHAAFLDVPQGQPDVVTWLTLAQRVAREPAVLLHWPDAVWTGEEARFHRPFPLVPAVYGLAYALLGESPATTDLVLTLWAVALPLAVAWAGADRGRPATLAGLVAMTLPLLAAQQGWMLADLPLVVLVTLAWGAMRRSRTAGLVACVPALLTKPSAALFLAGPLLAGVVPLWIAGPVAYGALAVLSPPRLREDPWTWLEGLAAIGVNLRPALWIAARGWRTDPVALGALGAIPALVLWSPPEHAARYALPLVPALAILVARSAPRVAAFAVGSGLVLLLGGYRPVVVHHQAENVRLATRALVAGGATAIEVWSCTDAGFGAEALAAIVDFDAPVPVRVGGTLAGPPPGPKRYWWEHVVAPPWRAPGPADAALAGDCDEGLPGWEETGRFSPYRGSSLLLPREVVTYRRAAR